MVFSESVRKYILSGVVAFVVIGLFVANVMASKQDEEFMMNESLFSHAIQLQSSGDLDGAAVAIAEVIKKQPNSEIANYLAGLIAAQNGENKQAAVYLQKTLDINPYKVEDPMFMIQLGEIFVATERYEDAKLVLLRCQESGWVPEQLPNYQEIVASFLAQIENPQ